MIPDGGHINVITKHSTFGNPFRLRRLGRITGEISGNHANFLDRRIGDHC